MENENELNIVRVYDAPVQAVWDAWTDPEQVKHWWGPRGFTTITHSKDLRPGGHWHYTMRAPDGTDFENTTRYLEVDACKRLVYDHGGHADRPPLFRVTVLFSERAGKTTMDMTMRFTSPEAAVQGHKAIKEHSGNSTWDRLAEHLNHGPTFVIARSFASSVARMYEMWTNPEHVARWLPPTGMDMEFIKPGFYKMSGGGMTMYGTIRYLEKSLERVVYRQAFVDANEQPSHHPMVPVWPPSMLTEVTFAAEGPARTRVTLRWTPDAASTPEQIAAFLNMRTSMHQGWTGSFDKLDRAL